MTPLYFEDFAVGQSFDSAAATMEHDRVVSFAEEFDPQPQHLSQALAATSQFGTLVASGWHTACLTMRLQFDALFSRIPGGGMGAGVEAMTWRRPVHPGDRIRLVIEVLDRRESRSRPTSGVLRLKTTTLNQRDQVVMEMTAAVLVPRRPMPLS